MDSIAPPEHAARAAAFLHVLPDGRIHWHTVGIQPEEVPALVEALDDLRAELLAYAQAAQKKRAARAIKRVESRVLTFPARPK